MFEDIGVSTLTITPSPTPNKVIKSSMWSIDLNAINKFIQNLRTCASFIYVTIWINGMFCWPAFYDSFHSAEIHFAVHLLVAKNLNTLSKIIVHMSAMLKPCLVVSTRNSCYFSKLSFSHLIHQILEFHVPTSWLFSLKSRIFWYINYPGRTCRTDFRGR